ncbi:hypothetical protein EPO66_00945 [bacterium]|nr:MAG: hypothetical protein EPO66_00945 [bacterium]
MIFSLCVLLLLIFSIIPCVFANGAADYYGVTISKFELYNGASWITAFSGTSSELDIAAASSGQSAGNFLSGLIVPDGTYTQVRVTPSPTFKFRGTDGAGNYTTAATGVGGSTPTANINLKATCTITLTGGNVPTAQTQDFSATPIVVKDGEPSHKVRVNFDVSAAIQNIGGELYPAPPTVTMNIQ